MLLSSGRCFFFVDFLNKSPASFSLLYLTDCLGSCIAKTMERRNSQPVCRVGCYGAAFRSAKVSMTFPPQRTPRRSWHQCGGSTDVAADSDKTCIAAISKAAVDRLGATISHGVAATQLMRHSTKNRAHQKQTGRGRGRLSRYNHPPATQANNTFS